MPLNGWHFIVTAIFLNKLPLVKLDGIGAVIADGQEAVAVDGGEGGGGHVCNNIDQILYAKPIDLGCRLQSSGIDMVAIINIGSV